MVRNKTVVRHAGSEPLWERLKRTARRKSVSEGTVVEWALAHFLGETEMCEVPIYESTGQRSLDLVRRERFEGHWWSPPPTRQPLGADQVSAVHIGKFDRPIWWASVAETARGRVAVYVQRYSASGYSEDNRAGISVLRFFDTTDQAKQWLETDEMFDGKVVGGWSEAMRAWKDATVEVVLHDQ